MSHDPASETHLMLAIDLGEQKSSVITMTAMAFFVGHLAGFQDAKRDGIDTMVAYLATRGTRINEARKEEGGE